MRNRHLLIFGQRFDFDARAGNRDVKRSPPRRDDDADVWPVTTDLLDLDSQPLARSRLKLVPTIEQKQRAARARRVRAISAVLMP